MNILNKRKLALTIAVITLLNIATVSTAQASFWSNLFGSNQDSTNSSTLLYVSSAYDSFGIGQIETPTPKAVENLSLVNDTAVVATQSTVTQRRSINNKAVNYTVPASAYSSTPDQTDDTPFITAMGTHVRDGVIAANFLPLGTVIKIPELYGDKTFVVEDRMNKRYQYKIDLWFATRQAAKEFGVKQVKIEIVS